MGGNRRLRRSMGTVAAALVCVLVASCVPQPGNDPFFSDPASVEPGDTPAKVDPGPGHLIRYRRALFTLDASQLAPYPGVDSYQLLYNSTSALGESNAVSGTLLIPAKPWQGPGQRPLVTYGVGTRGLGDSCAPSWTMSNGLDYEGGVYDELLARGWAVAVSDMVGLATPGIHTYTVGREEGTALLDIVRAAHQLPEAGLSPDGPVGIMGYSQGGGSAGWAAELVDTYAPELNIKGTAASGIPADLKAVARGVEGGPFVGLAMMAAIGFDAAYPELDLADSLSAPGQALRDKAQSLCIQSVAGLDALANAAGSYLTDFTKNHEDLLNTPAWTARLDQNKLGGVKPASPIYQSQAYFDQMVAYPQAAELRNTWCAKGANVTWQVNLLAEHVIGMVMSIHPSIDFLAARFADRQVTGNCPT